MWAVAILSIACLHEFYHLVLCVGVMWAVYMVSCQAVPGDSHWDATVPSTRWLQQVKVERCVWLCAMTHVKVWLSRVSNKHTDRQAVGSASTLLPPRFLVPSIDWALLRQEGHSQSLLLVQLTIVHMWLCGICIYILNNLLSFCECAVVSAFCSAYTVDCDKVQVVLATTVCRFGICPLGQSSSCVWLVRVLHACHCVCCVRNFKAPFYG